MNRFGNIEENEVRELSQAVGIVGDGQLAMLAYRVAEKLGIQLHIFGEKNQSPVGRLKGGGFWNGELILAGKNEKGITNWTDENSLKAFKNLFSDGGVVTTEWENVPAEVFEKLVELGLITCPESHFLSQIQDRVLEKELIQKSGGKSVEYKDITREEELRDGINEFGKSRLKSRKLGYDGGKQWEVSEENFGEIWETGDVQKALQGGGLILEKMVDIEYEVSVIVGVDQYGNIKCLNPIVNHHSDGILRTSISGIFFNDEILNAGMKIAESFSQQEYVGLLTIEMFVTTDGEILVNEFAPRPHNSGHITLDNNPISQFELWLRCVRGEDISKLDVSREESGVMVNILSQQEMLKVREKVTNILDGKGSINIGDYTLTVYDYQKVLPSDLENDEKSKRRKLGHMNIIKKGGNVTKEVALQISKVQGDFEEIFLILEH